MKIPIEKMITEIEEAGGRIDKIYHCSDIKEKWINMG